MMFKFFPITKAKLNRRSIFSFPPPGNCCNDDTLGNCCTDDTLRTMTAKTVWEHQRATPYHWTKHTAFATQRAGIGN